MKLLSVLSFVVLFCTSACATSSDKSAAKPQHMVSGHKDVNGLHMYYEIHGTHSGTPLVLLHGGGSSIDVTYSKLLPIFSQDRKVIAVDEQAHGKSGDRVGPVRFESSADDIAALLKLLEIEKVDVMGFSNGASVAMQVAIRHPQLVRKLVFVSAMTKKSGVPKEFWEMMKQGDFSNMPQSLKDAFLKVNPDPVKLKNMHDKDSERMRNFKDVSDKDVKAIKALTLIMMGDQDVPTIQHGVDLTKMIKGSRLLILPGGHGDFLGEMSMAPGESKMPAISAGLITEFLGKP